MTIYFDIAAAVHRHPGLGRYAASLGQALLRDHGSEMSLFYYGDASDGPPAELARLPCRVARAGRKRWRMQVLAGHLVGGRYDDLLPGARLYHATEHLLVPLRTVPSVLTVHDLLFRHFPRYHKLQNYLYLNLAVPVFCRRASAVIAVSEHTKRDLVRSYALAPDKVTVVYEAADPRFRVPPPESVRAARARYGLPERYLMTLCAIEPRKNHAGFLRAFERLRRDDANLWWVVGGRKGWLYEGFLRALERSPARDRVLMPGYIADEDLPAAYAGALAFVFPSFGEGFGLPVLEAMACGTPVLSSSATSLPEVGGDAACYFDPSDVESMWAETRRVTGDPALRDEMRQRGLERAAAFSWQRAARETWALYQATIGAGSRDAPLR